MNSLIKGKGSGCRCWFVPVLLIIAVLVSAGFCGSSQAVAKSVAQQEQKVFNSPEGAVKAFIDALNNKDAEGLIAIFGPGSKDLIYSGDDVADNQTRELVIKMFGENNRIVKVSGRKAILEIGRDNWPLPIPIVKANGRWRFDAKAGREEILNRRIGRNELGAIQCCRGYVDAQRAYASKIHNREGLFEYAQRFLSTPGKENGLYWEEKPGEEASPGSIFVANARELGYGKNPGEKPGLFQGYYFRILKGQGRHARGGAFNYIVRGRMIGGYALIAYPAKYGVSGIMTFIVNNEGVVYQTNLGRKTESRAQAIRVFDPDKGWQKVQ